MNAERRFSLLELVGRSREEVRVKEILLGTNGMVGVLEHSDLFTALSPLTRGKWELCYKGERLMNLSVHFPYVITIHDSKDKQESTLRITHMGQKTTAITLEEHNKSINLVICSGSGAILISLTNKVFYLSFSRLDEFHSYIEDISVPRPVKSLCSLHDNYCMIANQFEGNLFDVQSGKILLKLQLPPQSTAGYTLIKLFDTLVVAATALTIYFWGIEELLPREGREASISPKSIVTETPATCVAFDRNLFVGFAGGMVAMYSMDGTLLQIFSDPQINPITSSVTEQLQLRIKDLLVVSDNLYSVSSSGEVKKYGLMCGSRDVVIRKSQNVSVLHISFLKHVKELCVITKSTSQKSDINIYYFKTMHTESSKVGKLKSMGKEFKKKMFHSQNSIMEDDFPELVTSYEKRRLEVLHALQLLDTKPEKQYDKITELCRLIYNSPICLISLVDTHRIWFKSKYGLHLEEVTRESSFCAHTVTDDAPDVFVINAHEDPLFNSHPFVQGPPYIRFYAGAPIIFKGQKLGSLCIMDKAPRLFSEEDKSTLIALSDLVVQQIKTKHKQEQLLTNNLISYSLQTPLNNAKQCLSLLSEKYYRIQDDPLYEQLQFSISMSQLAINDSLHNYISKRATTEDISPISVVNLFKDLRSSFVPLPRGSSLPTFQKTYPKEEYEQRSRQETRQKETPRQDTDCLTKPEIRFILDPDCPVYLASYPVAVLRCLMDLIGGASMISENEMEVVFKPNRVLDEETNRGPLKNYSLLVEITIFGITIDEYTKKILFRKPLDDKCPFYDTNGKLLLYCHTMQKWMEKLKGSCFVEELELHDASGFSLSIEIPNIESESARSVYSKRKPTPPSPEEYTQNPQTNKKSLYHTKLSYRGSLLHIDPVKLQEEEDNSGVIPITITHSPATTPTHHNSRSKPNLFVRNLSNSNSLRSRKLSESTLETYIPSSSSSTSKSRESSSPGSGSQSKRRSKSATHKKDLWSLLPAFLREDHTPRTRAVSAGESPSMTRLRDMKNNKAKRKHY
eukprot:TRINITY_DN27783_c0_g1_i1.p1 TRINITY_DN27783_c0_g1~~TRINITY_DN27783_c0_g1_i1.p1  ORF type:complete len:1022 (+),score=218.76 TRINITY_DN27783_c0_g1_i1:65-3130(+)